MRSLNEFKIEQVPQYAIVIAATSEPDYNMSRILIAEDWPEYGDYTVITGGHCSCYGFDDTKWDAVIYTLDELNKVIAEWHRSYNEAERRVALIWFMDRH